MAFKLFILSLLSIFRFNNFINKPFYEVWGVSERNTPYFISNELKDMKDYHTAL